MRKILAKSVPKFEMRNGFLILPRRENAAPVTLEMVKRIEEEMDLEYARRAYLISVDDPERN